MKNKKIYLIIIAVLVVGAAVFYFASKKDGGSTDNNPVVYYNPSGAGIAYDQKTGQVESYNPETNTYKSIYDLSGHDPLYLEISPDQKSFLYATDPNAGLDTVKFNPDSTNITVKSLGSNFNDITKNSIFSPHWLNDTSIIYQALPPDGKGEVVVLSLSTGKVLKQIPIGDESPNDISILDDSHVVISPFASDVSENNSSILNLTTGAKTNFVSGNGLRIKTVPQSRYIAYQTVTDAGQPKTKLIDWANRATILEFDKSLENIAWTADSKKIYFIKATQLLSFDPATKTEKPVKDLGSVNVVGMQILQDGNQVLIQTDSAKKIIPIN